MNSPETLNIVSDDGAATAATFYPGPHSGAPCIVIWPAMGTPARFYRPFAEALCAHAHVVTPDLRGIGASSVRASRAVDFGYAAMVEQDWPAVLAAVRARLPSAPLYLLGHSLGGQLSALHAARDASGIAGLIFIASGSVYYRGWDFPRSLMFWLFTQSAALIAGAAGYFPGKRIGFGGSEARSVMRDWARVARSGRYLPARSRFDYEAALPQVTLPLLGISFAHDHFAPRRAMANLLGKMPRAATTHLDLDAAQTGGERIDHFSWVRQPQHVVPHVLQWLQQR